MAWTEDGWLRKKNGCALPATFADVTARPGYVRLRGQEVLDSYDKVSVLARKLTSVHTTITVKMEFTPEVHQHTAGIVLYYDNLNYLYLKKYYSETLGQSALSVVCAEKGKVKELTDTRTPVSEEPLELKIYIEGLTTRLAWSYAGKPEERMIGGSFDTSHFSDEYCGQFTGTVVGMACTDGVYRRH